MRHATRIVVAAVFGAVLLGGAALAQDADVPEIVKTLLAEGDRHRQAGRAEEAIRSYEEARRLAPSAVDAYVSLGALYTARDEPEKALEAFVTGLEHDPEQPNLLFNAAVISLRLGRPESALDYAERALAADRRNATLQSLKSAALRGLGRLELALEAQLEAAKLEPGNPQVQYRLGNLYYDLEQKEKAIEAYRKAVKKDKGYLRAWYNLGAAFFDLDRYDEALEAYRVALEPLQAAFAAGEEVDPANAPAFSNLGAIYFRQQDWPAALDAYDKALRLDPRQAGALYNQGFIYFELGRDDDAYHAYHRALELDPALPLAHAHLGRIEARRGNHAEAVRQLLHSLDELDGENRLNALLALGESYRALGRGDDSIAAFRAVLAQDEGNMTALVTLGRLLRDRDESEEAGRLLERARAIDPRHSGVALELAGLARAGGDLEREKAYYEEILSRSPERPEMWPVRVNLARVLVEQGRHDEARRIFENVVERLDELRQSGLSEREGQVLVTVYGLLLASEGDVQGARRRLVPVAGGAAPFVPAREAVAVLDAMNGDPEAAARVLEATLSQHQGGPLEAAARANLGQALWLAGRGREAREHLERAERAWPDNAAIQVALGEIAFHDNDVPRALERLETAVALCERGSQDPADAPGRELRITLGKRSSPELCERAAVSLGIVLVRGALADLENARAGSSILRDARQRADRALELPLGDEEQAVAFLVRGTVQLLAGADRAALADLTRSLDGLPETLLPLARNNLGVARYRLDEIEPARAEFEASLGRVTAAYLNLGVVLDERTGEKTRALELYESYLARGGRRSADAEAWAERLRKVYR